MKKSVVGLLVLVLAAASAVVWVETASLSAQAPVPSPFAPAEQLATHRNLGKAFYENPTTYAQSVEEFTKALELNPDSVRERVNLGLALLRAGKTTEGVAELLKAQQQDPQLPHTWFNLGIVYKKEGEHEKAITQFEKMVELAPTEAISQYNLGYLYRLTNKAGEALPYFEAAARLDPNLAGARFQLYNAYRAAGRAADAARELARFQELRRQQAGAAIPEDLDWSFYSEVYEPLDAAPPATDAPSVPKLTVTEISPAADYARAGLVALDYNADGRGDLLAWTDKSITILRNGTEKVADTGLAEAGAVAGVTPGDFNNDGVVDLAILSPDAVALWVNRNGKFEKQAAQLPAGSYSKAVWLDYDHDYDLDLILLGAKSALARNNMSPGGNPASSPAGAVNFSDMTRDFPFVSGTAIDGVALDMMAYDNGMDLAVGYAGRAGVIYRDRMGGRFEAVETPEIPEAVRDLLAFDWNNDGWTDLAVSHLEYMQLRGLGEEIESSQMALNGTYEVLLLRNQQGKLEQEAEGLSLASALPAFVDFDNRGRADLVAAGEGRMFVKQNLGAAFSADTLFVEGGPIAARMVAGDWDQDGRTDLTAISFGGALEKLQNETVPAHAWVNVSLEGVKNLKQALGARVEVKAGRLYQKQTYTGVPLHFGVGAATQIDTIRITWPNGLIQNETKQPVNQHLKFKEAQRLSGSCPMIFTWNGQEFQFITDVLGVAPLGASLGDGVYFPVDHDEFIQIPGSALRAMNGMYEIRITEELREVAYFDEVKLIAVDHPAATEIFTNDKFKSPPFPEFRLFAVDQRIYPKTARDHRGADVLPRLLKLDQVYPDGFRRDYSGVAEPHHLDLDFGDAAPGHLDDNKAVLILNGWLDWADGSTFRAVSQASPDFSLSLGLPYLQVKNAKGEWQTVIEDMGIPAGKPKTISVDLSGKFLTKSRAVRIVTGMALYWDEVFLGAPKKGGAAPQALPVKLTDVAMDSVELRFRGWSRPVIHPQRTQPERFNYHEWMPATMWNPTPGLYTRFGDVKALLNEIDDKLVVMGSGDEMRYLFNAASLPALPAGWTRDFLLKVDGWAKDQDPNTAFGASVEPLPFHGMSQYPYAANEKFPDDEEHRAYRREYNTRPALRIVRPLGPEPVRPTGPALTERRGAPQAAEEQMAGAAR